MSLDINNDKIIIASYDGTLNQLKTLNTDSSFTLSGTEGTPNQMIEQTNDGNIRSKWCLFHNNEPVIWQAVFSEPTLINSYEFVSGGDMPNRDPKDWQPRSLKRW